MLNLIALAVNLLLIIMIFLKKTNENIGLSNSKLEDDLLSPGNSTENSLNLIIASFALISVLLAIRLNFLVLN